MMSERSERSGMTNQIRGEIQMMTKRSEREQVKEETRGM